MNSEIKTYLLDNGFTKDRELFWKNIETPSWMCSVAWDSETLETTASGNFWTFKCIWNNARSVVTVMEAIEKWEIVVSKIY